MPRTSGRCFFPFSSISPAHVIILAPLSAVPSATALLRLCLSFGPTLTRCLWRFRSYLASGGLSSAKTQEEDWPQPSARYMDCLRRGNWCSASEILRSSDSQRTGGENNTSNKFWCGTIHPSLLLGVFSGGFFSLLSKSSTAVGMVTNTLPHLPGGVRRVNTLDCLF